MVEHGLGYRKEDPALAGRKDPGQPGKKDPGQAGRKEQEKKTTAGDPSRFTSFFLVFLDQKSEYMISHYRISLQGVPHHI